ncbi:MAG: carbonic anhydrase [Alphaproteobacteria bacterium]|nr:carbonic anhydrase [Alphaproteobacteria bacterium]MBV9373034.1 carbonic anhydrase [Alphaproteobacteria bacterium]MBV9902917.1 carbonic anhydrase [Alphaproteobacteria bacterium]
MTGFDQFVEGYRRFRRTGWSEQRQRWEQLAEGQNPEVMVIACSDSRVDPSQIFDAGPGEMFVVRNVAALVPPYQPDSNYHGVSAALEFAVTQLNVREIVVMGHGFCGGCAASLTRQFDDARSGEGHFIAHWIDLLDAARDRVLADHPGALDRSAFQAMEMEGVKVSLRNLRTFPWVDEREQAGILKLRGAFFSIADGCLHLLDEAEGRFSPA